MIDFLTVLRDQGAGILNDSLRLAVYEREGGAFLTGMASRMKELTHYKYTYDHSHKAHVLEGYIKKKGFHYTVCFDDTGKVKTTYGPLNGVRIDGGWISMTEEVKLRQGLLILIDQDKP